MGDDADFALRISLVLSFSLLYIIHEGVDESKRWCLNNQTLVSNYEYCIDSIWLSKSFVATNDFDSQIECVIECYVFECVNRQT